MSAAGSSRQRHDGERREQIIGWTTVQSSPANERDQASGETRAVHPIGGVKKTEVGKRNAVVQASVGGHASASIAPKQAAHARLITSVIREHT